ncbi:hypothetical protein BDZ45DRAFT_786060 [Acephala macrosclerotiorum]|nr:hypothetical protein BDZ45DRAFT_786060 [Acephala macrosclerotiorum]
MFAQSNLRNPKTDPIGPITYSISNAYLPPCECVECSQQYRSFPDQKKFLYVYSKSIGNAEAIRLCDSMVESINKDRLYVQQQLAMHRASIAKRWKKKTLKNREALLKSVDPDMYVRKWHEAWIAYESRYGSWWEEGRKHRNIHLLPYMSVENLLEDPSRIINLLHHRSMYSPSDLAAFDSRQIQFAWTTGVLETAFNKGSIVMYGERYGRLVPWDETAAHRGDTVGLPRGQLILEAQTYSMAVCRGLVEHLVEGLPRDVQPAPSIGMNLATHHAGVEQVSSYSDEAFSVSPRFDLNKLSIICRTRLNMAGDHFSQLQTDPAYMRRYVQLTLESEYSSLPEKHAYVMCATDIDYDGWTSRHIQCFLPHRPGFRHLYDFHHDPVNEHGELVSHTSIKDRQTDPVLARISNAEHFLKDALNWCIAVLTTNPDTEWVYDHLRYFEFLDQHLNKASQEERSRMDETLYRKISDLAAFNELLVMIRSHRPRAAQRNVEEIKKADKGLAWRFMSGENSSGIDPGWAHQGPLLKTFMGQEAPKDKSNRSWMDKDIAQRKKLCDFWDLVRGQQWIKLKDSNFSLADIQEDMKLILADTDPEHLAAVEAERKEFLAIAPASTNSRPPKEQAQKPKKGKGMPQGEVQSEWGNTPENIKPTGETKPKPKTRGETSNIEHGLENLNIDDPAANQLDPTPKVPVKKSALEIFTSLFPNRNGGSKSVLWDSFVDAMAKVGFMSRRSGGSAVTFEPSGGSKWYGQGSIAFHRPHPDSKIDPVMLHSIGKRMKKWFGWGKETFELGN